MSYNIEALSFSSLFHIILTNTIPGKNGKLQCFSEMMEWSGLSTPTSQNLSPWINGKRTLPEAYADILLQCGNYEKMYECISNNVLPYLINKEDTVDSIALLLQADNSISAEQLNEFFLHLTDPAHFIADVLFYTITNKLNAPLNINKSYKHINLAMLSSNAGLPKCRTYIVGRKKECKIICNTLKHSSIIFLYGTAGIGKSELAKHYIRTNKQNFENVIYIPFTANIKESIANIHFIDDDEDASSEDKFRNHLRHLHTYNENTIVLLDNFNIAPEDDADFYTLVNCKFQLIITTRNKPIDYPALLVKELQPKECIDLFNLNGPTDMSRAQIVSILEKIYYHTLLIVMIAKTLKYTELSYKDIMSSLCASIINTPTTTLIPVTKDDRTLTIIYKQYILSLIKLANISYTELDLLCSLALLPIDGVSCKSLVSYTENKTFNDINKLTHLGYINCDDSSEKIVTIHPLIGEIVLEQCHKEIPRIVKSLTSNFLFSVYKDKYYPDIREQRIAISIFQQISSFSEYNFCNEVIEYTSFFIKCGQYAFVKYTTNYIQNNSNILKSSELPYIHALAEYYHGIADVQLQNYNNAHFHFEKAANYLEDLSNFSVAEAELYFNSIIESAASITDAYLSIEKLHDLHIKQGCLPTPNYQVILGRLYFKFAEKYLLINQVNTAIEKFDECIKIRTQILGADSIGVGLVMGNIGYLFQLQKDYTNAISYYENSLKILYKYLPENHINIIKLHTNLGVAYYCATSLQNNISLSNKHFEIAKSNAEFLQLDKKSNNNEYNFLSKKYIEEFAESFSYKDGYSVHNVDKPFINYANKELDLSISITEKETHCVSSKLFDLISTNEHDNEDK